MIANDDQSMAIASGNIAYRRRKSSLKDSSSIEQFKSAQPTLLEEIVDILQDYDGNSIRKEGTVINIAQTTSSNTVVDPLEQDNSLALLCDNEQGFDLLLDRIKQSLSATKEVAAFLKKRAVLEEEYAVKLSKLVSTTHKQTLESGSTQGSFPNAFSEMLKIHEKIAEARLESSQNIATISEDLNTLYKNTDKSRKQLKESGTRHLKFVAEVEVALEKARLKYESSSEEWEKAVKAKETGDPSKKSMVQSSMSFLAGKASANPAKVCFFQFSAS